MEDLGIVSSNLIGNYLTGPDTLELVMTKEGFENFYNSLKKDSKVLKKYFSVVLNADLYDILEDADFRVGHSIIKIYPRGQNNVDDWWLVQHISSKHDVSDVVETPLISIKHLKLYYNNLKN